MPFNTPIIVPGQYTFDAAQLSQSSGWIEQQSSATCEFSPRYGNATLTGWISDNPVAFYNFVNQVLGYTITLDNKLLQRRNPIRHPRNQQLYATKITDAKGQVFGRKIDNATGGLAMPAGGDGDHYGYYKAIDYDGTLFTNSGGQTDFTKWARYGRQLVTIEFAPPRWRLLTDNQVSIDEGVAQLEYKRYVDFDVRPNFYNVTIQTGNFQYAEAGPGNSPAAGQVAGIGEINYLEVKTTFSLRWRLVPEDFIGDSVNYELPFFKKIIGAAGRVNSAPFLGYPAGTLLMLEPEIDRYVVGTLLHNDMSGHKPLFFCDVTLPIVHFDPPNSSGDPPTAGNRGHNLKPWWASGATVVRYYLVTNSGTSVGMRIYGSYDYPSIFTHWSL